MTRAIKCLTSTNRGVGGSVVITFREGVAVVWGRGEGAIVVGGWVGVVGIGWRRSMLGGCE